MRATRATRLCYKCMELQSVTNVRGYVTVKYSQSGRWSEAVRTAAYAISSM